MDFTGEEKKQKITEFEIKVNVHKIMDKIPKLKYLLTADDLDKTVKLLKFNLKVISANLSLCDSTTQVSFKRTELN
jgi:hypothetical protein